MSQTFDGGPIRMEYRGRIVYADRLYDDAASMSRPSFRYLKIELKIYRA